MQQAYIKISSSGLPFPFPNLYLSLRLVPIKQKRRPPGRYSTDPGPLRWNYRIRIPQHGLNIFLMFRIWNTQTMSQQHSLDTGSQEYKRYKSTYIFYIKCFFLNYFFFSSWNVFVKCLPWATRGKKIRFLQVYFALRIHNVSYDIYSSVD